MDFQLPARPVIQSKTVRREWRRDIRRYLGTSSDQPPSLPAVLRAVNALNNLLVLTSDRRYTIELRCIDGTHDTPSTALRREIRLRDEHYERTGRYPSND